MNFATFFSQYGLFFVLAILLVFMVLSTRRRNKRMKEEQEKKAQETVPGAKVLLQGGIYGTIVEFDPENLDRPAKVEVAPGRRHRGALAGDPAHRGRGAGGASRGGCADAARRAHAAGRAS